MEEINSRTVALVGSDNVDRIAFSHVLVVGVGGVGGYVVEMLARAGVGKLTIVDYDIVDKSNINRQIIALGSTVGKNKVDVLKERIKDINSKIVINAICKKVDENSLQSIFQENYDYVVDAVDDTNAKLLLAKTCKQKSLKIISALGSGNRFALPKFEITDIYKTHDDGLAKKMRKLLRDEQIQNLDVVYTCEKPINNSLGVVGSISYYPAMCGVTIAAFVINKIINSAD